MKLWVDYTNWKGQREWREIVMKEHPEIGDYHIDDSEVPMDHTWVWSVQMVDRNMARRTLRLTSIHGFHVGETHP